MVVLQPMTRPSAPILASRSRARLPEAQRGRRRRATRQGGGGDHQRGPEPRPRSSASDSRPPPSISRGRCGGGGPRALSRDLGRRGGRSPGVGEHVQPPRSPRRPRRRAGPGYTRSWLGSMRAIPSPERGRLRVPRKGLAARDTSAGGRDVQFIESEKGSAAFSPPPPARA